MEINTGKNKDVSQEDVRGTGRCRDCTFAFVSGVIVDVMAERTAEGQPDSCVLYFTVEDDNGNITGFMVTPDTFVLDFVPLTTGMRASFWYRTDAPAMLIYPPRYTAVAAAQERNDRNVNVSFYDSQLINQEITLQLRLDDSVRIRTTNNQYYMGNPGNQNLLVCYTTSTRSIPAQTTPQNVYVLCQR